MDAEKLLKSSSDIAVPFPEPLPPKDAKYKLEFSSPAAIAVVGSFALNLATKFEEGISVDLAVTMPTVRKTSSLSMSQHADIYRLFYKPRTI